MSETHKLAVILFADIAGYTALMEEDEGKALATLNRFKEIIETRVPKLSGQIVQFFGDGALLAFDSSSKAIACAADIQKEFLMQPQVPVRIGMHLGDVLFKNGNAFGNGVNVASRIESLGVPGAILMSKVIRNQIKNKGDYELTSLGSFDFKNVEEPMEVFALSSPGFVVPRKSEMQGKLKETSSHRNVPKYVFPILMAVLAIIGGIFAVNWFQQSGAKNLLPEDVRKEKVAIAVFNNFTNDPELDAFGNMASDWISRALRELKVKTASPEMMRRYTDNVGILPGNPDGNVSLKELTDAEYVLTGSYYLKGDSIQVVASLESTETGDPIYDFPAIWGLQKDKEKLIIEIQEQLKGYWRIKEVGKLSTINPPKYEAYQQFLKCGLVDPLCFKKVLAIDSTFILTRVYLALISQIQENDSLYLASSRYVRTNWDRCTEFEKNFFAYVESMEKTDYQTALIAMKKNHQLDSLNLDILHHLAYGYIELNQPAMTVKLLKPVFDRYEIFKNQIRTQSINAYFKALNRTGQHEVVIEIALNKLNWRNNPELIRALMLNKDLKELQNCLELISPDRYVAFTHMYNAHFPLDSNNLFEPLLRANLGHFTDPKPGWDYYIWSNAHLNNMASKAFAHYQLKEWEQVEKILLGLRDMDWETDARGTIVESWLPTLNWHMNSWREGLLGCTFARQGKIDLAHTQIEQLESFRATFPGTTSRFHRGVISYWQARIHAVLGEKEEAVTRLGQSLKEGRVIEGDLFIYDWDLKSLKGYEPYEELVRPQ